MPACKHCGGEIGHDGFAVKMAMGGGVEELDEGEAIDYDGDEVSNPDERMGHNLEDGWELEERQATEGEASQQQAGTKLLREGAFADAIRSRRYAEGGEVPPGGTPEPKEPEQKLVGKMTVEYPKAEGGPPAHGKHSKKDDDNRMAAGGPVLPADIQEMKRKRYGFGGKR